MTPPDAVERARKPRVTVKAALEHAAELAMAIACKTTLGPCDTYHNCEAAGRRIAEAIRAYSKDCTPQEVRDENSAGIQNAEHMKK